MCGTALQIRCVVPGQFHPVCDAGGKFVFGVGHIDHRSAGAFAEMFDYGPRQLFVAAIQPVQRFVEDQQVRVFDKGACKQYHPLFAGREADERSVSQMPDSECVQPSGA